MLVLEGVNNPDNIGGLFRSAAAFGIELVVLGPNSGDPLYRKADPHLDGRDVVDAVRAGAAVARRDRRSARRRLHGRRADAGT